MKMTLTSPSIDMVEITVGLVIGHYKLDRKLRKELLDMVKAEKLFVFNRDVNQWRTKGIFDDEETLAKSICGKVTGLRFNDARKTNKATIFIDKKIYEENYSHFWGFRLSSYISLDSNSDVHRMFGISF